MDLLVEDYLDVTVELSDPPVDVEETRATPFESDLIKVRDQVSELLNLSLMEFKKQLKEIVEKQNESIDDYIINRWYEREQDNLDREDRIEEDKLELEEWLKSLVTKLKKPADEVSEDYGVNDKMYRDLRRDLVVPFLNMETRSRNEMFTRHIRQYKRQQMFIKKNERSIEALETSYINLTADIHKRLDDMWTKFNVPNPHTSGGPLEKTIAPQTSRNPSEINPSENHSALPRDSDLKRAKSPSPITRLLMKIKGRHTARVSPITHQNEHDANEGQSERKLQERIMKMFQITGTSGGPPLDKATTPQTSSKPSVSSATPQERNWECDPPSKPQWEFRKSKYLPSFIRIRKKMKVKALKKARVTPVIHQNENDADERQSERKQQERIKMFQFIDTSGGPPLDKATTLQTSSKPSVSSAALRECKWGIDPPSKPQWDFKRANFLPPIRKKTKVKAYGKARVTPVIHQNKNDADERQSERKQQERIKMFQFIDTSGGPPLDKATTLQTSSKPSVSSAALRECKWGIDPPSKPQWDFKRANFLPPIRKKTKVKAYGKARVTPVIHQNENDADERQSERKQQERIKMFQFIDTSGGPPLDKATTLQTSSKPSVSSAALRECNWGIDPPSKPQWDFKRANFLPPIRKTTKVKAYGKARVTPVIQQHEHDVDEVQIGKFEVKIQDEKTSEGEVQEQKAQRKWRIFSRFLFKRLQTASKPAGKSDRVASNPNLSALTCLCI